MYKSRYRTRKNKIRVNWFIIKNWFGIKGLSEGIVFKNINKSNVIIKFENRLKNYKKVSRKCKKIMNERTMSKLKI